MSTKKKWSTMENPILKTWRKVKSFGHISDKKNKTPVSFSSSSSSSSAAVVFGKSRSWHVPSYSQEHAANRKSKKDRAAVVAPHGCFTVYVGREKRRFVVKTKLLNHHLFKKLLEDAETEYGYRSQGPIVLPCEVDVFIETMAKMESREEEEDSGDDWSNPPGCGLCSPQTSYSTDSMAMKRHGSYSLLRTPPLLKLNSA